MRIPPLALLIICAICFFFGWKTNGWRLESQINASKATQVTATLGTERSTAKDAAAADVKPAASQQAQEQQARVITKEVIRYVQSPAAGQCHLPSEWVQIHDAAAGVSPTPSSTGLPSAANGEAGGSVTDSEAIGVIARNYDICLQEINRLQGWQAWYRSVMP